VNDTVRKAESEITSGLTVEDCAPGDVNADGDIGLGDAVQVLQILTGAGTDALCPDADVNGDRQIGVAEAVFILNGLAE